MSLGQAKLGTLSPVASHTLVLRTRRLVREELERSKVRRSLLWRTLLPSLSCTGIALLIMFHPEFDRFWIFKLGVGYYWMLAVLIPWLVVRKERQRNGETGGL
jgi:hypothetical protein